MAGIAKPNIPELGKETTVNFLSSRTDYTPNFKTELFDGSLSSTNSVNSALFFYTSYTGCFVEFEVTEKCRIWGYTLHYSDGGGNLLNPCALYKKDEATNQYIFVKNSNTPIANQWYTLFDELEVGTYKIQSSDGTNYSGWIEWYVEQLEKENISPLKIKKTLKDNLPTSIDSSRDEIYFTEDGGIYLSKNDGTIRQVGIDDETKDKIADIEDKIQELEQSDNGITIVRTMESVVPVLSNNGQGGYNVTTSSEWSSAYSGWKVFNSDTTNGWCSGQNQITDQWLQIELPVAERVEKFTLKNRHADTLCPNTFGFYGSNDGTDYDLLHSENGLTWDYLEEKSFKISNNNAYKYYKIIGSTVSPYNNVSIGVMQLYKYIDLEGYVKEDVFEEKIQEIDNKINDLSQNGGSGDVINNITINEMSNPLTMNPLDYGYFKLSGNISNYVANEKIPFDNVVDGNMESNNGVITLKAGKTYYIQCGVFLTHSIANQATVLSICDADNGNILLSGARVPSTHSTAHSGNDINGFISPQVDTNIVINSNYNLTTIHAKYSNLTIQEVRNNPVNQYGGFETDVLFEGKMVNLGEYTLEHSLEDYNYAIVEFFKQDNLNSLLPVMTSNTTPAPYSVTVSGQYDNSYAGYKMLDGNLSTFWSSNTSKGYAIIDFGVETDIDSFSITARNGSLDGTPCDFTLYGSNDNVSFEEIESYTDETNWTASEKRTFYVGTQKYRYYKLDVTKNNGRVRLDIALLEFYMTPKEYYVNDTIIIDSNSYGVYNEKCKIAISKDKVNVLEKSSVSKIIGIKGQIPSLLVGGEF